MKKLRLAILVVLVAPLIFIYPGCEKKPERELASLEVIDIDSTVAYDIRIYTNEVGKYLNLNVDDGELQITGDANMDEAAEDFFYKYIKPMADAYIENKLPFEIDASKLGEIRIISECPYCGRSLYEPEPLADK